MDESLNENINLQQILELLSQEYEEWKSRTQEQTEPRDLLNLSTTWMQQELKERKPLKFSG